MVAAAPKLAIATGSPGIERSAGALGDLAAVSARAAWHRVKVSPIRK